MGRKLAFGSYNSHLGLVAGHADQVVTGNVVHTLTSSACQEDSVLVHHMLTCCVQQEYVLGRSLLLA